MLNFILLIILCIFSLLAVALAHYRLNGHAANTRLLTRSVLILTGAGFGWVMAFVYTRGGGLAQLLVFVSAFGFVHLPAACVLQLKHWRGIPRHS